MSIPPDRTHILGAGGAWLQPGDGADPVRCKRVPGNGGDAGDLFFVQFYVGDGILVEVRFFKTGAGCDAP